MKALFSLALSIICFLSYAQSRVDVLHYRFDIGLSDRTDSVYGRAAVRFKALEPLTQIELDLVQSSSGKGMHVIDLVNANDTSNLLRFMQKNDKLIIQFRDTVDQDEQRELVVVYAGIPKDGLIISKNRYGDRTFFADNWPNRARNWIPCNDVPSDKASFEFAVSAPSHYQVISNGVKVEERALDNGKKLTHWKENIPLSTKIMVIGVARFAVKVFEDSPPEIPVSAWVYPQDSINGFHDYALATDILRFFSGYIAPYPYGKLANVQSKTIFGGMENASAIFYSEESVTGTRASEDLLAHEIAHQWFGDMASEKSFEHLWLSEGFATYFTNIYLENKYGRESIVPRLRSEREQVIGFAKGNRRAVVDSTTNLMSLLNANSYQKGAWVLHMLRNEVGEEKFKKIIQSYYQQFKGSNAETRDLTKVASLVMNEDMRPFFHQWLYRPGIPDLRVRWKYSGNKLSVRVQQLQKDPYVIPLDIEIVESDGSKRTEKLRIHNNDQTIVLPALKKPAKVNLDPGTNLLFTGNVSSMK